MNPSGPSPHLSWTELGCRDGTPYPEAWRQSRLPELAELFERIRKKIGRPITVGSGYRTLAHDRSVGTSRSSQHVEGRALDLYTPTGITLTAFHAIVRAIMADRGCGGIGYYSWGVHVDTRPGTRLDRWSRPGAPHRDV